MALALKAVMDIDMGIEFDTIPTKKKSRWFDTISMVAIIGGNSSFTILCSNRKLGMPGDGRQNEFRDDISIYRKTDVWNTIINANRKTRPPPYWRNHASRLRTTSALSFSSISLPLSLRDRSPRVLGTTSCSWRSRSRRRNKIHDCFLSRAVRSSQAMIQGAAELRSTRWPGQEQAPGTKDRWCDGWRHSCSLTDSRQGHPSRTSLS